MIAPLRYHEGRVAYPQPEQLTDARNRLDFERYPEKPSPQVDCTHLVVLTAHGRTASQARHQDRQTQQQFFDRIGYTAGFRVLTQETKTDQDSRGVWIRHEIVYVIESRPTSKKGYVKLTLRRSPATSSGESMSELQQARQQTYFEECLRQLG